MVWYGMVWYGMVIQVAEPQRQRALPACVSRGQLRLYSVQCTVVLAVIQATVQRGDFVLFLALLLALRRHLWHYLVNDVPLLLHLPKRPLLPHNRAIQRFFCLPDFLLRSLHTALVPPRQHDPLALLRHLDPRAHRV